MFDRPNRGLGMSEPHKIYNSRIHYFTQNMSNQEPHDESEHSHLANLSDGAGCTEVWEHLSESRDE